MSGTSLKIAHVVRRFVFEEWGGTESVVWNTVRTQIKLGVSPEIFATCALSRPGDEIRENVRIRRFPYWYPYFPMTEISSELMDKKGGNPFVPKLFQALRQGKFDLIHIHCGGRMAVMSILLAHELNIPCVVSLHGGHAAVPPEELRLMMAPTRGKFHYGSIIDRLMHLRRDPIAEADGVICISHEEEQLLSKRYPGRRIIYLPNGVNCEEFQHQPDNCSPRREWGIPPERRLVLCISRIDYQKNQGVLLNLLLHDPKCHVLLIGPVTAPWYHKKILDLAEKLNVTDRLTIIPGLAPEDPRLKAILHEAQMFVMPSVHEPFGIVALEAWAAGIPLLTAWTGGLRDFVTDERNGLFFDPADPYTLISAYDRLVREKGLAERLSAQAREDVRGYSWKCLTERLLQFYLDLIRERA